MIDWPTIEELLDKGQSVSVKVRGVSMYPTLFSGDQVTLEPSTEAAPGDIVLAKYPDRYVIHRLWQDDQNRLSLKGDNSLSADGPNFKILGRVTARKTTLLSFLKRVFYSVVIRLCITDRTVTKLNS